MTTRTQMIAGVVFEGVGPDGSSSAWVWADGVPPSTGDLEWRSDLSDLDVGRVASFPGKSKLEAGSATVKLPSTDEIAGLFLDRPLRAVGRLEEAVEVGDSGVTVDTGPTPSSAGFVHLDGEVLELTSTDVSAGTVTVDSRGSRKTQPLRHPEGTLIWDEPPYWRSRMARIVTWSRASGIERHPPRCFVSKVTEDATTITVSLEGAWSALSDVDLSSPVTEDQSPFSVGQLNWSPSNAPNKQTGIITSPYYGIKSPEKQPTASTGATDRGKLVIDNDGRIWRILQGQTTSPGKNTTSDQARAEMIAPSGGLSIPTEALPDEESGYGVGGLICVGTALDKGSTFSGETHDLLSGDADFAEHAIGAVVALLRSLKTDPGAETRIDVDQRDPLDLIDPEYGIASGRQLMTDAVVSSLRTRASELPTKTIDHWLAGHKDESLMDAIRRALSPLGLELGVTAEGAIDVYELRRPAVEAVASAPTLSVQHRDGIEWSVTSAPEQIREITVELGIDTDWDYWESTTVHASRKIDLSAPREFRRGREIEIDGHALAATDGRAKEIQDLVVRRIELFNSRRIKLRLPFDGPRLALGDTVVIDDLDLEGTRIVRDGARDISVKDSKIVGIVVSRKLNLDSASWTIEVVWRAEAVQHRAPAGYVDSVQSTDGSDDTVRLVSGAQWGNDVTADGALFNPGDEVDLWTRSFVFDQGPFVVDRVLNVSGEPRDVVLNDIDGDDASISGSIEGEVLRLSEFDTYDDDSRRYGTQANPWAYFADEADTLGSGDEDADIWG